MFITKTALTCPIAEQLGSPDLSKIESRNRIKLATSLKTGLFHGRNTYCVWGRHFCLKTRLRTFLEIKFFARFFGYIQLQISVKTTFYAYFQRFCGVRLKSFLFYNKVENLFMRDIIQLGIDFIAIFSSKQK